MGDGTMNPDSDRTFHLDRAAQCRRMAAESLDATIRQLHEELAEFHEAEARRLGMPAPEGEPIG